MGWLWSSCWTRLLFSWLWSWLWSWIFQVLWKAKPRLSQRLMLSTEPTDMVMDLDTVHTPLDMADTLAMDTDMVVGIVMGMAMDTMVELLSVNQHILVYPI